MIRLIFRINYNWLMNNSISNLISNHLNNLNSNPFELLGSRTIGTEDNILIWEIRTYMPYADKVLLLLDDKEEIEMNALYEPYFFECKIRIEKLPLYRFKIIENLNEKKIYDPYFFTNRKMSDLDFHLFSEGNHHHIYEKLGAHLIEIEGVKGVFFSLWAPNAINISVIGDFNHWDGRVHQMCKYHNSIWELFIPGTTEGDSYKFKIKTKDGTFHDKTDPYGYFSEIRPKTASIVSNISKYNWNDSQWMQERKTINPLNKPISIYEIHLGSWLHESFSKELQVLGGEYEAVKVSDAKGEGRFLSYYELTERLLPYVLELGYTHIQLMPIMEHPFDGSWGYQVTGYYAPTSRYGRPEDLMYFIDKCHSVGIGVILDWVPGHFPKDGHGLGYFDGTHLYEHENPMKGEHKEWGTLIFNYGRNEVKNFLIANAMFWFEKYHIDGLRIDAVASMLYLDYLRKDGEWEQNIYGGNENLEASNFLRHLNSVLFQYFPGILSIAEESSTYPMVTGMTDRGGLGFNLKWNMGWMHDMLDYFALDTFYRKYNQNYITFSMWYNYTENYMLALSHDEIVHGKRNILNKMPSDNWQKFANHRCLFAYMFCHPGKKTMFMSMEFAQWNEWNVLTDLDWQLLEYDTHSRTKIFFSDLNTLYKNESTLFERDFDRNGFEWIDCSDTENSVISFIRRGEDYNNFVIVVCNFTAKTHFHYRIGVPENGFYTEIFNSDLSKYGGSNQGNFSGVWSKQWLVHNFHYSLEICLPPLSVIVLKKTKSG